MGIESGNVLTTISNMPPFEFYCRKIPSRLMLTNLSCKARKKANGNPVGKSIIMIGEECLDCEGALRIDVPCPIPIKKEEPRNTPAGQNKPDLAKTLEKPWNFGRPSKPHKCLKCGETDPAKFYGSAKSECRACSIKRYSKRQKALGWGYRTCTDCKTRKRYRITKPGTPTEKTYLCHWCRIKASLKTINGGK